MLAISILLNLTIVDVLLNALSTNRERNTGINQGICALCPDRRVGKTIVANTIVPGYTAKMICV
jgi:hypothetical protein